MTAPGLVSVIGSPTRGTWYAQIYSEWVAGLLPDHAPIAGFHAKFWGKSMVDEEQEWLKSNESTTDMAEETNGSTTEENRTAYTEDVVMSEDKAEDEDEDEDGSADSDFVSGCYFLDLGMILGDIEAPFWIRAEYIRVYDTLEAYHSRLSKNQRAPGAVVTGQPGIGE